MNPSKPLHLPAALKAKLGSAKADPYPKPGTKWRPLHRVPHNNNQTISIRRFVAGERKK